MRIAVLILLALCTHSQASKKGIKNTKKIMAVVDDEMALLDALIQDNDIRSHYNVSSLDPKIYLPTIIDAREYAEGMFEGLSFESDAWLSDSNSFHEYVRIIKAYRNDPKTIDLVMQADIDHLIHLRRASSTLSIWYLLKSGLITLLRKATPDALFFEFVANVFVDIDLVTIFDNANLFCLVRSAKQHVALIAKTNNRSRHVRFGTPDSAQQLLEFVNFYIHVTSIDITSDSFSSELDNAVEKSLMLHKACKDSVDATEILSSISEVIARLHLWRILRPLINRAFLDQLKMLRLPKPSMHRFKSRDVAKAFRDTMEIEVYSSMQQRFVLDRFFFLIRYEEQTTYSDRELLDIELIRLDVQRIICDQKFRLRGMLLTLNSSLFSPHVRAMTNRTNSLFELKLGNIDEMRAHSDSFDSTISSSSSSSKSADFSIENLRHRDATTLKQLLFSNSTTELPSIKWNDIDKLIHALGGFVQSLGGSTVMVYVPGFKASPTRFELPARNEELGHVKGVTLRAIFTAWGVKM